MAEDLDRIDVRRVLAGDSAGFEGIVRRWQTPLINLAFRFVRDRERAEDMAQEAFLRVFQQLARFRGDSAFSTWMFSVALNVYRSTLRRRALPSVPLDAVAELVGPAATHLALEDSQREDLVRRAVAGLPPRYRDALTVFYFRDMNLAETAQILNVPEGTAKALLHRGRKLLHHKLGGLASKDSTNDPSNSPTAREALV
ncbi:MAG TPA: sigma-70 family RNA polymerase sigma factor [Thermoanaerobaculia bacterium]|jgi:RNA polymerase sigma-70 factor (ECF subfamily)|nr:sigma-70 family RNA polymerase sigma factor [Thermoanaerobaculia bacterium]